LFFLSSALLEQGAQGIDQALSETATAGDLGGGKPGGSYYHYVVQSVFEPLDQVLKLQRCTCLLMPSRRWKISRVDAQVWVIDLHSQGYGLQLIFSDGHDRGIYPWPYLAQLAPEPTGI
jgi:hypothetical protein